MKRFAYQFHFLCCCIVACGIASETFAQETVKPRLILIGDSTVKNGSGRGDGGLWGWGQVLDQYFDTKRIEIENRARGGRSSRTYLTEGLWQEALERVRPGDFLIMQFGHNDGAKLFESDRPRGTIRGNGEETERGVVALTGKAEVVHTYGWYLRKYIADTRAKGATPIVCSLVPRDRWQEGKVIRANKEYGKWAAAAARDGGALFIDLNEIVAKRYEQVGEETVDRDYFTAADWTHTTKAGAGVTAECVAAAIRELPECPLATYLLPMEKAAAQPPRMLKFGFGQTVQANHIRVNSTDIYSSARGYGFEPETKVESSDAGCTSDTPFYFSVALPEGNYRVRATFAPNGHAESATVKAELRRLMVPNLLLLQSAPTVCEFTVNTRTPAVPGGQAVKLKPREKESEVWAWDDKLTLEFNGPHPCVSALTIEPEPTSITVYLAGDSTVTDQPLEPWNSWGQMLPRFFQPGVAIANYAQSGESIRSSLGANRFEKIFKEIKPGDYLFIQFSHNDMKNKASDALANYRADLVQLVEKTRQAGAQPVLVTSMERKAGWNKPTLMDYPQTVRDVAVELDVPLIDLNALSVVLYKALGADLDKAFQDGTHHTNYGSYLFARGVVQAIRDLPLDLASQIRTDVPVFDPRHPDAFDSVNIPVSPKSDLANPAGS